MKNKTALDGSYDPANVESGWYDWWIDQGYFHANADSDAEPYVIVIPPPNVTGALHMGHALFVTIQDTLIRWRRMEGREALWLPGTDHAGIATQTVVERLLRKRGISRHDLGREKFIEHVWEWKEKYGGRICHQLRQLGASVDWERERFTMDEGLSNAVRETFVRLWEGLIYRAERLVNWDPATQTVLSNLEVEAEEEQGHLWHIRYPLTDDPESFIVVATTRPETMLGDTAVAVHPSDERYKDLIGKTVNLPLTGRQIPIVGDAITANPEFGSGAVKITPAHDFNDWECGQRNGLEMIQVIGLDARINDNAPEKYRGLTREDARTAVVADLTAGGYLVKIEDHAYMPGRSQRSGVIVEPLPMTQWWVRMEPLAAPAIKVVEDGDIKFVPEMWTKVYFEWMRNIRDWCISRQLWWGHQIPAWHCGTCSGITVDREDPAVCGECGSADITQDPDVLDTWFSSGLWPFSTLGWPEKTADLAKFYPGHVMETGFDILFFWVARMIFMSLHLMGEIPFDTVFLHAMVRDKEGGKMSKVKGNVIDPLHLIHGVKPEDIDEEERDNYAMLFKDFPDGMDAQGCDALRMTLAIYAAQGRDIKLDVKRVEGYRQFLNKLWNASKFALMHLGEWTPRPLDLTREKLTPADRWILGRLQVVTDRVHAALETFQLNDAALSLYNFIWGELCDWYIELSKPILYEREEAGELGGDVDTARTVLAHTLEQTLRLMHPMVPFITEEIWQVLPKPAGAAASITIAPWPVADDALRFEQETADIERAIELISRIRNIRGETGVKPSVKIDEILLLSDDAEARAQLQRTVPYLQSQAGVVNVRIEVALGTERPAQTATAITNGVEVHIPLAGLIDVAEETARLQKALQKVAKDIEHVTKKLGNPRFVDKAPDHIVDKEREKQAEFVARKAALETSLQELQQLA